MQLRCNSGECSSLSGCEWCGEDWIVDKPDIQESVNQVLSNRVLGLQVVVKLIEGMFKRSCLRSLMMAFCPFMDTFHWMIQPKWPVAVTQVVDPRKNRWNLHWFRGEKFSPPVKPVYFRPFIGVTKRYFWLDPEPTCYSDFENIEQLQDRHLPIEPSVNGRGSRESSKHISSPKLWLSTRSFSS